MKKVLIIMSVLLSLGLNAFAAGDLTVTGNASVDGSLNVGTSGIKFSDGSTQTTAIPQHGHSGPTDGGKLTTPNFFAYRNSNVTITSGKSTTILFNVEADPFNWYDPSTGKFQPTEAGYYLISATIGSACVTTMTEVAHALEVNDTYPIADTYLQAAFTPNSFVTFNMSALVSLNGTTDYVKARTRVTGTGTCYYQGSNYPYLRFSAVRLSN
jgi:hypothetical protein